MQKETTKYVHPKPKNYCEHIVVWNPSLTLKITDLELFESMRFVPDMQCGITFVLYPNRQVNSSYNGAL